MNRSRIAWTVALVLLLPVVWMIAESPSAATAQQRRIGVFPLRLVGPGAEHLAGRGYERWLAEQIVEAGSRPAQVRTTILSWPGDESCPNCTVSFGALLKVARAADVHGFVLATVTLLEAAEENSGPSTAGRVAGRFGLRRGRDRRKATVRIALEGGLVDSGSGEVVMPLSALAEGEDDDYEGPDLAEVLTAGRSHRRFSDTPLPPTADTAAVDLVAAMSAGTVALSGLTRPEPRLGAPQGLQFTQAVYEHAIEPAANQWLSIEVYNGAAEARSVLLEADAHAGIVAGFMGRGSADDPARLEPGEWKHVRLVITADQATESAFEVPIKLYDLGAGSMTASAVTAQSPAHDEATVRLTLVHDTMRLSVEPTAESGSTLARHYRITNVADQAVTDLSIAPEPGAKAALFVQPSVQHATLEPGASIEVTVGPHLYPGFESASGTVRIQSAAGRQPLPVSFAVPSGERVWLAAGNSRRNWLTELGFCTNQGAEDSAIGGPAMGPLECAFLAQRIASYKDTKGLYEGAPDQDGYRDWTGDDLQDWVLAASGGRVAGTTDATTGDTDCDRSAFQGAGDRINQWEYESCVAHETLHSDKHVPAGDAIVDRANANSWSPSSFKAAMRDHMRDGEIEAYDVTLGYLRQKYAESCGGSGGGSYAAAVLRRAPELRARRTGRPLAAFATFIRVPPDSGLSGPILLGANFELAYGRDNYSPHDTRILFNGHPAAELENTIPEGRYLFEIDPEWLDAGGNNRVSIEVENMNWSHYLVASQISLNAPVTLADRMVIASSQEEADRLYATSREINHGQPDLTVTVAPGVALPAAPADGELLTIPVRVVNLSEVSSPGGLLRVHNQEIGGSSEEQSSTGLPAAVLAHFSNSDRVAELVEPIAIPPLGPFEEVELPVELTYDGSRISRLVFSAELAGDFNTANNAMPYTFVAPDLSSPLLGTDYPDLTQAPILSTVLELPTTPEIEAQNAIQLESFLGRLDYLDHLAGAVDSLLRRFVPR